MIWHGFVETPKHPTDKRCLNVLSTIWSSKSGFVNCTCTGLRIRGCCCHLAVVVAVAVALAVLVHLFFETG